MPRKAERRQFGQISKLPSGRYRARYADPDGRVTSDGEVLRHSAPHTFDTKGDAEAWLADERRHILADTWSAPSVRRAERARATETFAAFAALAEEPEGEGPTPGSQDPSTTYPIALKRFILPTLGIEVPPVQGARYPS